jgi:uncharacterized protein (TIGR00369 family)
MTSPPPRGTMVVPVPPVPFPEHLGFAVIEAGPERVVVHAEIRPEHATIAGTAHGGFLMSLADFAGAIGAYQVLPEGAHGSLTIESSTNMTGQARVGTVLHAIATPIHVGRRTSVWQTRIETPEGRLVSLTKQTQLTLD